MKDRKLNVTLLLKYVISHWYIVLVCVGLCAGLLVGQYIKTVKTQNAVQEAKQDESLNEMYEDLSGDEKNRVAYTMFLNDRLLELNDYIKTSPVLNKSAYDIDARYVQYVIEPDHQQNDKVTLENRLLQLYTNYYYNKGIAKEIYSNLPKDKGYTVGMIADMIYVKYDTQLDGSGVFNVIIVDEKSIKDFDKYYDEALKTFYDKVNKTVAPHKLITVSDENAKGRVDLLADLQDKIKSRYDALRTNLRTIKINNEMTDNAVDYYDKAIKDEGYHFNSTIGALTGKTEVMSKKSVLKRAIVGFGGGLIVAGALLVLYYIFFVFNKVIISGEDASNVANVRSFGEIKRSDPMIHLLIPQIQMACQEKKIKDLAVLSSDFKNIDEEIKSSLSELMAARNIHLEVINDILHDSADMDRLFEIGNAVLLEKVGRSSVRKTVQITEFCKNNGIGILGVISVNE